jgi:hypothetical protein
MFYNKKALGGGRLFQLIRWFINGAARRELGGPAAAPRPDLGHIWSIAELRQTPSLAYVTWKSFNATRTYHKSSLSQILNRLWLYTDVIQHGFQLTCMQMEARVPS